MGQQKDKIEEIPQEHEIDLRRKKAARKYNRGKAVAFDVSNRVSYTTRSI